jgi:hypothetical protein
MVGNVVRSCVVAPISGDGVRSCAMTSMCDDGMCAQIASSILGMACVHVGRLPQICLIYYHIQALERPAQACGKRQHCEWGGGEVRGRLGAGEGDQAV